MVFSQNRTSTVQLLMIAGCLFSFLSVVQTKERSEYTIFIDLTDSIVAKPILRTGAFPGQIFWRQEKWINYIGHI